MTLEHIVVESAAAPAGAYSQGVVIGDLLFTAGMGPIDPATGQVVGDTVGSQTEQVLANLAGVLAARGRTLADVVKSTVHLADLGDFAEFDAAYRRIMPAPYPVRTTVGSTLNNILVEIDFVARG